MQKEVTFDLRLNGADANETLALIMACHGFLYNCIWHMRGDYAAKETQQIYCNMHPEDLAIGRKELSKIASQLGWADSDWRLTTRL